MGCLCLLRTDSETKKGGRGLSQTQQTYHESSETVSWATWVPASVKGKKENTKQLRLLKHCILENGYKVNYFWYRLPLCIPWFKNKEKKKACTERSRQALICGKTALGQNLKHYYLSRFILEVAGTRYDDVTFAGSVSTQFNGVLISAASLYLLLATGSFILLTTYLINFLIQNPKQDWLW